MNLIKKTIQLSVLCLIVSFTSCKEKYPELEDGLYAEIITNQGTMVIDLAFEKAPITTANFVSLAEGTNTMVDSAYRGKKYYNGLQFHRIIDEFMIQGGDPLGTGSGGPGYKFNNEISEDDLFKLQDEAQKETDAYVKKIDDILTEKEKEVMEV